MRDAQLQTGERIGRSHADPENAQPGRSTLPENNDGAHEVPRAWPRASSPSLFGAGTLPWANATPISSTEGTQMIAAIQPSPMIENEEAELEDEEHDDETAAIGREQHANDAQADAPPAENDGEGTSVATAAAAKRKPSAKSKVPSSKYATAHGKEMKNFTFKSDAKITNLAGLDFGAPDTFDTTPLDQQLSYWKGKLAAATTTKERKRIQTIIGDIKRQEKFGPAIRNTVSVDLGTAVGFRPGKRGKPPQGFVLAFHKTFIKRGGKTIRLDSNDHTGWIPIAKLGERGQKAGTKVEKKLTETLAKGKGSGHRAPLKDRKPHTFAGANAAVIAGDDAFRIKGGSASTPLGNYTVNSERYGDVIIGVWNPPGSGAGGKRFSGSGGIRAFFPLDQKFFLCDVGGMTVEDTKGTSTSTWRYVYARIQNEPVYCWLLQNWTTPQGSGHNFT